MSHDPNQSWNPTNPTDQWRSAPPAGSMPYPPADQLTPSSVPSSAAEYPLALQPEYPSSGEYPGAATPTPSSAEPISYPAQRAAKPNPLSGLFANLMNVDFTTTAAPRMASGLYILALACGLVWWISSIVFSFISAATLGSPSTWVQAIVTVLTGWLPIVVGLGLIRFLIELTLRVVQGEPRKAAD